VQYTVSVVTPLSVRHWSVVIDITSSISRFRTSSVVAIVHARWSAPSNYVVNIQWSVVPLQDCWLASGASQTPPAINFESNSGGSGVLSTADRLGRVESGPYSTGCVSNCPGKHQQWGELVTRVSYTRGWTLLVHCTLGPQLLCILPLICLRIRRQQFVALVASAAAAAATAIAAIFNLSSTVVPVYPGSVVGCGLVRCVATRGFNRHVSNASGTHTDAEIDGQTHA